MTRYLSIIAQAIIFGIWAFLVSLGVARAETVQTVTEIAYDSLGRPQCTAVRMNPGQWGTTTNACQLQITGPNGPDRVTKNVYDAAGQLLQVRRAVGTSLEQVYTTYTYSADGKPTTVIDANGNRAALTYDGFDRQVRWYMPDIATIGATSATDFEGYGYDANGNRTSWRRRDGRVLTFSYDALNRVTTKGVPIGCAPIQVGACPPATATRDVYYGYDLQGHQLYARFDSASGEGISNAYDNRGRMISTTSTMGGTSRTVGHSYDAGGNLVGTSTPRGSWLIDYDGLDRPQVLWEGERAAWMSHWYYDASGFRATVTERFGTGTTWSHDAIGRLSAQADSYAGGTGNVTIGLGYNPASQIVQQTGNNDAYAFAGYITVNRGYTVDGLNQYAGAGGLTFGYDANGNFISDGGTSYAYDAENRLIGASGAHTATLVYDPLGRLFQTSGGSAGTTQFLYDGDQLVQEFDGAGNSLRGYVHGPGQDDPILWYEGGGYARWLHSDTRGSIVAMGGGPDGAMVAINAYDEYGIPAASNLGRFQYTGQAWIPELGMYYYKARIYSPTLGRFMQTDPIGYKDQINLYAYVGNDPVNGRDPDGMYTCLQSANCEQFEAARQALKTARDSFPHDSQEYKRINGSLINIGEPGEGTMQIAGAKIHSSGAIGVTAMITVDSPESSGNVLTVFSDSVAQHSNFGMTESEYLGESIAHEADPQHKRFPLSAEQRFQNERSGFQTQDAARQGFDRIAGRTQHPFTDKRLDDAARGSVYAACSQAADQPSCK